MKRILLTLSALVVGTAAASAADLPARTYTKAPPPPPAPVFSWTGCYVGGNVGWIGGLDRFGNAPSGAYLLPANFDPAFEAANTTSATPHGSGVTGGAQVGCNWQIDRFVFGGEADINGSSLRETAVIVTPDITNVTAGGTLTETKKIDWFSTFRGRLGIAVWDRTLLYATGGLAVANVSSAFGLVGTEDSTFAGSASTTRVGWTVGAGAEWMFAPNWSVKAEYLYIDLGTWSYASPNTSTRGGPAEPLFTWTTSIRTHEQIARVGVNYHFNWGAPVAANY